GVAGVYGGRPPPLEQLDARGRLPSILFAMPHLWGNQEPFRSRDTAGWARSERAAAPCATFPNGVRSRLPVPRFRLGVRSRRLARARTYRDAHLVGRMQQRSSPTARREAGSRRGRTSERRPRLVDPARRSMGRDGEPCDVRTLPSPAGDMARRWLLSDEW